MTNTADQPKTRFFRYSCPQRHLWNVAQTEGGQDASPARVQITCSFPYNEYQGRPTGTFAQICPECGEAGQKGRKYFTGRHGAGTCESICATATGGNCKCSCGGTRHGISA